MISAFLWFYVGFMRVKYGAGWSEVGPLGLRAMLADKALHPYASQIVWAFKWWGAA